MTMTIESEPTGKKAFTLWPPETQVRLLLRVQALHGRGRWRVANPLSDDLDPALRLVDVEHVRGTGQRDQPLRFAVSCWDV
jgi:hypothetical protein